MVELSKYCRLCPYWALPATHDLCFWKTFITKNNLRRWLCTWLEKYVSELGKHAFFFGKRDAAPLKPFSNHHRLSFLTEQRGFQHVIHHIVQKIIVGNNDQAFDLFHPWFFALLILKKCQLFPILALPVKDKPWVHFATPKLFPRFPLLEPRTKAVLNSFAAPSVDWFRDLSYVAKEHSSLLIELS